MGLWFFLAAAMFVAAGALAFAEPSSLALVIARIVLIALGIVLLLGALRRRGGAAR